MDKLLHCIDIFLTPFYFLVSFVDTLLNFSEKILEFVLSARLTNPLAGVTACGGRCEMEAGTRNANSCCNLGHMSEGNYNSSHAFSRSRTREQRDCCLGLGSQLICSPVLSLKVPNGRVL